MMRYRNYSYEEYERAMELLNKGFGITTISKKLGIPKSTLHYWRHNLNKPPTTRWIPKPSSELAYVLGVLLGDGYIVREHHNNYDIELLVKDYDFAEEFSKVMARVLDKNFKIPRRWRRRPDFWRVYYQSKAFHQWFKEQTLDTLKPYIEYNRDTVKYFLRGIYDSEGCNYRCKQIFLSNNDLKLLSYIQYLLKKYFSIKATGPYLNVKAGSIMVKGGKRFRRNHNNYYITISKRRGLRVFLSKIGFSIRRKQLGLPRRM